LIPLNFEEKGQSSCSNPLFENGRLTRKNHTLEQQPAHCGLASS